MIKYLTVLFAVLLLSGLALSANTIIQGPNIFTGFINATSLVVSEITGHKVTGLLSLENNRIVNTQDPLNPQDAATKAYVDRLAQEGGGGGSGTANMEPPVSLYSPEGGPYSLPEINGEIPDDIGYVFVGEENAYMVAAADNTTATNKYIAVFHLPTLKYAKTVQIPLTTTPSSVHGIEFGGFVYVADNDEMLRYSLDSSTWERLPLPAGKRASFFTRTDSKLLFGSRNSTAGVFGISEVYEMFGFDFAAKNWSFLKTIPDIITRSDFFAGFNPARLITHQGETVYGIDGGGDSVGRIVAFNTDDLSVKRVDTGIRDDCGLSKTNEDVDVLEVQAKDNSLFLAVIRQCASPTQFMVKASLPLQDKPSLKIYRIVGAITGSTQYYGVHGVAVTNMQNPDRFYQMAPGITLYVYDGNFNNLKKVDFQNGLSHTDSSRFFFWKNLFFILGKTTLVIKAY